MFAGELVNSLQLVCIDTCTAAGDLIVLKQFESPLQRPLHRHVNTCSHTHWDDREYGARDDVGYRWGGSVFHPVGRKDERASCCLGRLGLASKVQCDTTNERHFFRSKPPWWRNSVQSGVSVCESLSAVLSCLPLLTFICLSDDTPSRTHWLKGDIGIGKTLQISQ